MTPGNSASPSSRILIVQFKRKPPKGVKKMSQSCQKLVKTILLGGGGGSVALIRVFTFCIVPNQEPITRSLHLPYYSSEPTLSRIFLFLEAPPTEVFAGVFVITNHERATVTHCLQVTGNQSYLHLHGLHDSKRKLMFFVHRLIPQRFDRF